MRKKQLDGKWLDWLRENITQGCSEDLLFNILQENGFPEQVIKNTIERIYSGSILEFEKGQKGEYINASPRITDPESGLNALQLVTNKLQIYILDDFLDIEKCNIFVDFIEKNMEKSTLTDKNNDDEFRTSSSSHLSNLAGVEYKEEVDWLEDKIANTLGIPRIASEGIQAQHYTVGQQFKQHGDAFEASSEYEVYAGELGQRTWTFMVYLNDVPKGGGTEFFAVNKVFMPKRGQAVIWNNLHPDGTINYDSLHAGLPVEEGKKIIITKWFRTLKP